jgi:hypothetical protein
MAHPLKLLLDELRKIVVGLGMLSPAKLREIRDDVRRKNDWPQAAKELILDLIEIYLQVGPDARSRAEAAAACLLAIDEIERQLMG